MEPLKLSEIAVAVNGTCPNLCDIEINEISTDSQWTENQRKVGTAFAGGGFMGECGFSYLIGADKVSMSGITEIIHTKSLS